MYGVEIVPQAIEDARRMRLNGMDNVNSLLGRQRKCCLNSIKEPIHADVIVVDPPRKGCDTVCLDTFLRCGRRRLCM